MADAEEASYSAIFATLPLDLLSPPADRAFDCIAHLTRTALHADIALVDLIDGAGIWHSPAAQTGLGISMAARENGIDSPPSSLLRGLADPVVAQEHGFAFYACVPLQIGQANLGKLVILDRKPRDARADEIALLRQLGAVIVEMLEVRFAAARQLRRASGT